MANSTIGSSIGLTGTPREYTQLYKYNQQLQAAKQKAKQDNLDDIIKDVTVKVDQSNLHDLEVKPMEIRTAEFIDRARQSLGQDDMSAFYDEFTNYQADLNNAKNRSSRYWQLEKTVREAAAGNKYVPKNVRQAAGLMLNSASSADYIQALNDAEVKRNAFFDYDDQGRIMTQSIDAYDINKKVKDIISGNSVIIQVGKPTKDEFTGSVFIPKVMGLPMDDTAADEVKKIIDPDTKQMVQPSLTAKQIPAIVLSDENLAAQYIDQYNLEEATPEEIEQHFFDNMVKPNVKLKESMQVLRKPGTTNINVSTGTAADYAFEGSSDTGLLFGVNNKSFTVDSPYSVPLAFGELQFRFTPKVTLINKNTSLPYGSAVSSKISVNYANVLPYEMKGNSKIVISNERVKALRAQGKKVKYAAFIEGKTEFIGAEGEMTNPDFYTELNGAVKANIANVLATKGKAASAAWARGIADIDKKVAAANR
jgi:hypothetical protein